MSLIVSERTREVGVRLALGAEPSQLLTMVVGQATKLAAIGVTIGIPGAMALEEDAMITASSARDAATRRRC
jgi:putative ABC transport system permease protein